MKLIYEFTIPGNPRGFYVQGKAKDFSDRAKKYREYKRHVQTTAWIEDVLLPLTALKEAPLWINTVAYFKDGVHCDPENVHKGVVDAVFYKAKGGDKYTGGAFAPPLYDKENPRVEVAVYECEPGEVGPCKARWAA